MVGSVKRFYFCKSDVSAVQGHPRPMILVPIGGKRVFNFLLVRHGNFGPILHSFGDIASFCAPDPPLFHPNFGDVPAAVEIAHVGVSPNINLKLFT